MTNQEFSDQFDVMVSSFKSNFIPSTENADLVFNEYEKSIFLTRAYYSIVISLYNGGLAGYSFENNEELRRYLAPLVQQEYRTISDAVPSIINDESWIYELPNEVMVIIYESVDWDPKELGCKPWKNIRVVPVTHDEFHKLRKNPFRGMNDSRVLRLDSGITNDGKQYVELYSKHLIKKYKYRYLKKPTPIVLEDLPDGLSIEGENTETHEHESLNVMLSSLILEKAVAFAITTKGGQNNNQKQNQ